MKEIYYFLDPAYISTSNIHNYKKEQVLERFVSFVNQIRTFEKKILYEGEKKKIFKIPFKNNIIDDCLMNPPSLSDDQQLSNTFYRTFSEFKGKYVIECNNNFDKDLDSIYENPDIPSIIKINFNNFLKGCINDRNDLCECKDILTQSPIFITSKTSLNQNNNFISFSNPNEFLRYLPLLNLFPSFKDTIKEKSKKFLLILEYYILQQGIDLISLVEDRIQDEQEFQRLYNINSILDGILSIQNKFWESDLLFNIETDQFKLQIINVISDLLINPGEIRNRRHKLNNEYIRIEEKSILLEQLDIFQEYKYKDTEIYPRLIFTILENKIHLYDIINRH